MNLVPESVNPDELQKLLDDKRKQKKCKSSAESMFDIATKHLDAMIEDVCDPVVHKTAALLVLDRMIRWHMTMAQQADGENALAWSQDSGRLSAAYDLLREVSLGESDFMAEEN